MTNPKFQQVLRDNGYSVTTQRQRVFTFLQNMHAPIAVSALAAKLTDIDRVSVYRTVDLFEKVGITHRVWNGFKSKIELSEIFSPHHHHFTCLGCGRTISLESDAIEAELHALERKHNFVLTYHSVELTGYCAACRSQVNKNR